MPAPFSRRRFLRALTAAGLVTPCVAEAAEEKAIPEIVVDKKGWGTASPEDIQTVLFAAAWKIWRGCRGQRIRPIRVYHRDDFPQTDFTHDWRGRIRIGLASEDRRWAQMAFQFSHEFCHALAQHSETARRGWHPARHENLWFEESLCETASLYVLRGLGAAAQFPSLLLDGHSSGPAFEDYATERLARPEHQLPAGISFPAWLRENENALRENADLRAKNVIIARQMLPFFEAEPAGWDSACYLNLGRHQRGKSRAQYFAEWQSASPASLRPFLSRLTAVFASSAGAPRETAGSFGDPLTRAAHLTFLD